MTCNTPLTSRQDKLDNKSKNFTWMDFEITSRNFDHFVYLKKATSQNNSLSGATPYIVLSYDKLAEKSDLITLVEYGTHLNGKTGTGIVLRSNDFYNNCFYVPKKSKLDSYKTYSRLVKELGVNPSQSKLKKLFKAIGNARGKEYTNFKDLKDINVDGLRIYYNIINLRKSSDLLATAEEAIN